jgi:hypothetical protein
MRAMLVLFGLFCIVALGCATTTEEKTLTSGLPADVAGTWTGYAGTGTSTQKFRGSGPSAERRSIQKRDSNLCLVTVAFSLCLQSFTRAETRKTSTRLKHDAKAIPSSARRRAV